MTGQEHIPQAPTPPPAALDTCDDIVAIREAQILQLQDSIAYNRRAERITGVGANVCDVAALVIMGVGLHKGLSNFAEQDFDDTVEVMKLVLTSGFFFEVGEMLMRGRRKFFKGRMNMMVKKHELALSLDEC